MGDPLRFPIRTDRLLLRPFLGGDLGALNAIYGREDVARYLYWRPQTLEDSRAMLERILPMTDIGLRRQMRCGWPSASPMRAGPLRTPGC